MTNSEPTPAAADAQAPQPASKGTRPPGLGSTLKISALTLASRVLGLLREQIFAALIGAGFFADAFVVAFRIPNLLRDLFAEGALSAAFVPTFAKVEAEQGKEEAHAVANRVVGALTVVIGALTLAGIAFATPLVEVMAPGYAALPGKIELTARLAQLMMPFLLLVSLAAVMMGMLNARARFSMPALAPALFNLAAIGTGVALKLAGAQPETAVVGWALGTLAGGLLQFAVQVPQLWKDGYRLVPRFFGVVRDPAIRRIARLMAPAVIGLAATQVNIFINTGFASDEPGANAWLNYAFRLMYLPIGIFGVAIATVTTSNLARRAAQKDLTGVASGLNQGLRHVALLTVPSTVGLAVLASPLIALLFQHGRFTSDDTVRTAWALVGYSVGLYAYSGVKVVAPAFYALDTVRAPIIASACAVATNLVLNGLAHRFLLPYGIAYIGIAVGTSLGAIVNLVVLIVWFRRLTRGTPPPGGLFLQLCKVLVATALMGAAVWALDRFLTARGLTGGTVASLVRVGVGLGVGVFVYAAACRVLRVGEADEVLDALRRRRRRQTTP